MADDVKPGVIKETQEILTKFIKKPVLTEKLLKKPPFRFLHDICTSAMKETGFFSEVLNGPEDKIENIKDRESKIAFLRKVISAVESHIGTKLTVKPSKIVAGLEPTKTNEFLQALGKVLEKKSQGALVGSEQNMKQKQKRGHLKDLIEPKEASKQIIENGVQEKGNENKKSNEKHGLDSPRKILKKKTGLSVSKTEQRSIKHKDLDYNTEAEKKEKKKGSEVLKKNNNGAGENSAIPIMDIITLTNMNGQGDQKIETKDEILEDNEMKRKQIGKQKHRRSSIQNVIGMSNESSKKDADVNESFKKLEVETQMIENNNLIKTENIVEPNNVIMSSSGQIKEPSLLRENTLISRPRTNNRPMTARPASARPAAPRVRERGEVPLPEEKTKSTTGNVQVITDNDINNEAEDDTLITVENTADILIDEIPLKSLISNPSIPEKNDYGHLVNQILEAQKELESNSKTLSKEDKSNLKSEIGWESCKTADFAIIDLEKLRFNIQTLTRSSNPLGKLLDFFQEDIDNIQRELEHWKTKNANLNIQISHEKSVTEQFIEPLKIHLKEIQQSIEDQFKQINIVKANIIRNNQKIEKLLVGI